MRLKNLREQKRKDAIRRKEEILKLNLRADYVIEGARRHREARSKIGLIHCSYPETEPFTVKDIPYLIITLLVVIVPVAALGFMLERAGIL